jgi:hypothetical protein
MVWGDRTAACSTVHQCSSPRSELSTVLRENLADPAILEGLAF